MQAHERPVNPSGTYDSKTALSGISDDRMREVQSKVFKAVDSLRRRVGGGNKGLASSKNIMRHSLRFAWFECVDKDKEPPWAMYLTQAVDKAQREKRLKELGDKFTSIVAGNWMPARCVQDRALRARRSSRADGGGWWMDTFRVLSRHEGVMHVYSRRPLPRKSVSLR